MVALELSANATGLPVPGLLEAFDAGTLGLSFSIAGFLLSYFVGIYTVLRELGVVTPETKIAGASSGGLMAISHCAGITDRVGSVVDDLCAHCRTHHNCQRSLDAVLRGALEPMLPADAHRRCSGKIWLSITQGRFPKRDPPNLMVSSFTSKADLVEAAGATSYIPLWSGAAVATQFRGKDVYDGFFSNPQPCPEGVTYCVRISSKNPPWDKQALTGWLQVMARSASLGTGKPPRLSSAPPGGLPDASALRRGAPAVDGRAFASAAAMGVDIAPGIFTPTELPDQLMVDMVIQPPDPELNRYLYDLGRQDAAAWADATGLSAAAARKRARQG